MPKTIPGYIAIEGMGPDGDELGFIVSRKYLQDLERRGPKQKLFDAYLLPETLRDPLVIFEGLNREDFHDGYCYCSLPSRRKKSATIDVPSPPGMVFLAFVRPDSRGYIVLDWEWRLADDERPAYPASWEADFGRPKWTRS